MSELPFADDDSDEPERPSRGRALWAFAALASAAVIIVALMVFLLGDPSGSKNNHHDRLALPGDTSSASATGSASTTTPSAPTSTTATPPTAAAPSSASSSTSNPAPRTSCPSSAPCISPGDPGGVIAAINTYRQHHGAPAATGSVTRAAQQCALHDGDQSACPTSYSWEPVDTATGAQVIQKITARSGGGAWLLDRKATSFEVGWAYVPGSHGAGGHYSCAIVTSS
jgi:hypothetical protein